MTAKRFGAVLGVGVVAAQAGHLLAFELRYGGAALQVQSTGAHSYFPTLARTGLGLAAAAALATAFIVAAARMAGGGHVKPGSAPSFGSLLPLLYTVQLACFGVQETLEAVLGGSHASSAPLLLMWGAAGQLPIAIVASLTLRWLLARLEPALAALRVPRAPAYQRFGGVFAFQAWPLATAPVVQSRLAAGDPFRGPPSF